MKKQTPTITKEQAQAMMRKCLGGVKSEKPKEGEKTND